MVSRTILVLFAVNLFTNAYCGNILFVPLAGHGSHYHVMLNTAEELLHRGHNITMLVADRHENQIVSSKNPTEAAIHFIYFPSLFTMDEYIGLMTNLTTAGLRGRPVLPNTKAVGGLTAGPGRSLAVEWIEFLESAGEDGVVLFSMGSYANGIDEDVASLFAGAFAQLPQKVIWKLNGKPSATLTPNVKVVDWIPQNDLLGHPQIKAFVYHCGLNGIWEAVYHGVPMVAVPLFGDQFDNAQRLVSRGMAVKVDISTLTSDELAQAIRTVISDPIYKNNATRISAIFRDSPRTPKEQAADWIEYVIRHCDAKHLRSAALDLNIFQYLLLDVIAVLLLAFVTFMIILYCSCRLCFRGCRRLCGGLNKVKTE
ncbi:UDP-glucuronosyltransferase 2B31-like isoform X3 [Amphiura filiformis]|uniref:UDP-glucuronosyltransferase 2B31-like isoform X3 n=1 Tax=Amphiura filiformis TaxID=82378 RepID=UPI003B2268E6